MRRRLAERWHAYLLTRRKTGIGTDTLTVQAHLSGAQQLLQMTVSKGGKMPPEPPVKPEITLFRGDFDAMCRAHARTQRITRSPAKSPPTERPTEPNT